MTTRDEDRARRARYAENERKLAESNNRIAYLTGKMEAAYESLPRDETVIAEIMEQTGADREKVVAALMAKSERELAALAENAPDPAPADLVATPAVERFRELLG